MFLRESHLWQHVNTARAKAYVMLVISCFWASVIGCWKACTIMENQEGQTILPENLVMSSMVPKSRTWGWKTLLRFLIVARCQCREPYLMFSVQLLSAG